MWMMIAGQIAAAGMQPLSQPAAICEIGRLALNDIRQIRRFPSQVQTYYGSNNANRVDLIDVCPALKVALPAEYPLADEAARERASVHAPIQGRTVAPALILEIDVPRIADDPRKASVDIRYECTGLCGASFVARYVRTANGWCLDGRIEVRSVS